MKNPFDVYDIFARVLPGILLVFPVFFVLLGLIPEARELGKAATGFGGVILLAYPLGAMTRHFGRGVQSSLFKKWGGKPANMILRHRDTRLNRQTKARHHEFLRSKGFQIPTPEEEHADPLAAEEFYDAAVDWLREVTRDKGVFDLVFKENVAFGFARNMFAVRWAGRLTAGIGFLVLLFATVYSPGEFPVFNGTRGTFAFIELALALLWLFLVRLHWVETFGWGYAEAIAGACDRLSQIEGFNKKQ